MIIQNDAREVQFLREQLIKNEFEVNAQDSLKSTYFLSSGNAPHLILLDDNGSTAENVAQIRQSSQIPILVLSSSQDSVHRIASLEAGADDYLVRPFEERELIVRLQSIMRRFSQARIQNQEEVREWRFRGLNVQSNRRRVLLDERPIELTTAEFELLRLFVKSPQHPLSREAILNEMRGIEWEAVDRSVDILVSRLREKLRDDPRRPRFIRTVRSVGYEFVAEKAETDKVVQNP